MAPAWASIKLNRGFTVQAMADILLTHANHLYSDRKQVRKMQPYPPLQTLIAAACLRRHGYDVALFDPTLNSPLEGFQAALAQHRPRLVAVCEDNFNFLTKMCLTQNREMTFSMFRAATDSGAPALVNSSDASDNVAAYLEAGARFVLIGELEKTLLEVADLILRPNGGVPEQIHGLGVCPTEIRRGGSAGARLDSCGHQRECRVAIRLSPFASPSASPRGLDGGSQSGFFTLSLGLGRRRNRLHRGHPP